VGALPAVEGDPDPLVAIGDGDPTDAGALYQPHRGDAASCCSTLSRTVPSMSDNTTADCVNLLPVGARDPSCPYQPASWACRKKLFSKRILFTNRDDWPVADVVAAYRSQSEVESGFRQMKNPHVVSFGPMHHWTHSKIRVHVFYCVLALTIAHSMRRQANDAGLDLCVRELLNTLVGIGETVLLHYDGGKGHPPSPQNAHRHGGHREATRQTIRHRPLRTHPLNTT